MYTYIYIYIYIYILYIYIIIYIYIYIYVYIYIYIYIVVISYFILPGTFQYIGIWRSCNFVCLPFFVYYYFTLSEV